MSERKLNEVRIKSFTGPSRFLAQLVARNSGVVIREAWGETRAAALAHLELDPEAGVGEAMKRSPRYRVRYVEGETIRTAEVYAENVTFFPRAAQTNGCPVSFHNGSLEGGQQVRWFAQAVDVEAVDVEASDVE